MNALSPLASRSPLAGNPLPSFADSFGGNEGQTEQFQIASTPTNPLTYRAVTSTIGDSRTLGKGRFLSPDRRHGNPAAPQSWNRYAYAGNNPLNYVDDNGEGTRPANDPRVNAVVAQSGTMGRAIAASPNYSPAALEGELGSSSLSPSLIGVAGEAEMVDRMNSVALFGIASFQPRPPGGGQPDIMLNYYANPMGTAVLVDIAGPGGGLGYVPMASGNAQAYLEVKATSNFSLLQKGAAQTAATAASIAPGANAVSVLVVDAGAWQKLNPGQQAQLLKSVGGGFIQLQKNLISNSIKRAYELKQQACQAIQGCQSQ
jgi:hypothetical protein